MTGEVLLHENTRLQERMNQFIDRVELSLKQALRIAASQGNGTEAQAVVQANILIAFVLGRWQRYAKTAFAKKPTEPSDAIAILLR